MFKIDMSATPSKKSIYFWNTMGSVCNAASSVIFLMIVTRVLGTVEGGIFSIAFAISQQAFTFSHFEMTTYQVTDYNGKYKFNIYHAAKIFLITLTLIFMVGFLLYKQYSFYKCSIVFLMCLYKLLDAYSGIYFALFQKNNRLDIAGFSFSVRVLVSILIFLIINVTIKSLIVAIVSMTVFSLMWIILFELHLARRFTQTNIDFKIKKILMLLKECFPLFLASFLLISMVNQPKYAIDSLYDETVQNIFGILIMPAAFVNLLGIFIYRPLITKFSKQWAENKRNEVKKSILKLSIYIFALTILCAIVAYFIGTQVLSLLYGVSVTQYKLSLCVIIFGGGMSAIITLLYNLMAIMRHQTLMSIAYIGGFASTYLYTNILVKNHQILGASISYTISMFTLLVIFCIVLMLLFKLKYKEKRNK